MARLTTKEAAAYVGVAKRTLDHWRTYGGGPRFIKAGRKVVYDIRQLDQWMEDRTRRSTAEQTVTQRRRRLRHAAA
jgi:excisionase family DNA binding protein